MIFYIDPFNFLLQSTVVDHLLKLWQLYCWSSNCLHIRVFTKAWFATHWYWWIKFKFDIFRNSWNFYYRKKNAAKYQCKACTFLLIWQSWEITFTSTSGKNENVRLHDLDFSSIPMQNTNWNVYKAIVELIDLSEVTSLKTTFNNFIFDT